MNEKAREIIETAKEFIRVTKKAEEQGIIGITQFDEVHIFEVEDFETLVASATQRPVEKERDCNNYHWEYVVEVDGIRFICLSNKRLQF